MDCIHLAVDCGAHFQVQVDRGAHLHIGIDWWKWKVLVTVDSAGDLVGETRFALKNTYMVTSGKMLKSDNANDLGSIEV